MATNRTIEILLKAKNATAAGLASAASSMKKFGVGMWNIAKSAAIGIAALGTAVTGIAVKALMAFSESESAVNALKSSLRSNGDEAERNAEILTKLAEATQDETGASAEATLTHMGKLRAMGVEIRMLDAASKSVIGLMNAGMSEEAAIKAVAMAHAGNFTALGKLSPAIRNATTDTEKAALANELMSKSYQAAKDKLNTVQGAWGLLKERVGDVWEEIGKAIAQNGALQNVLKQAGDVVKDFAAKVADWAGNGGVTKLVFGVMRFGENVRHEWNTIKLGFGVMGAAVMDGWSTVVQYVTNVLGALKNNYVVTFGYIKDYALAVFNKIKHPFAEFKPPSIEPVKKALVDYVKAIAGKDAKVTTMMDAAMSLAEQEEQRHIDKMLELKNKETTALEKQNEKQVDNEVKAIVAVGVAKVDQAKVDAEALKAKQKAEEDALKKQIENDKEALKAKEELAKKTVGKFIEEKKQKKDEQQALDDDQKKADKIRAKIAMDSKRGLGRKLSKQDMEFLKVADAIAAAQKQIPLDKAKLAAKEKRLEDLQAAIEKNTKKIADHIQGALVMDGAQ